MNNLDFMFGLKYFLMEILMKMVPYNRLPSRSFLKYHNSLIVDIFNFIVSKKR